METLVEQLLQSPKAKLYIQQAEALLREEAKKREAFYELITERQKVEFINGEIIFHSPVKLKHNQASGLLFQLLNVYVVKHELGFVGIEKIMTSLTRNDYEPDVCFFGREKYERFSANQMKFPPPDFVAEVLSDSTEGRDRGVKFEDYEAHGVAEYWIVDPEKRTIEQYVLRDNHYELLLKTWQGDIVSVAVDGFVIPVEAVFDERANLAVLNRLVGKL